MISTEISTDDLKLPQTTLEIVGGTDARQVNPGLLMDKLTPCVVSKGDEARRRLRCVCNAVKKSGIPKEAMQRRAAMLEGVGALRWTAETAAPMALHLSRATVVENAAICMHPVFGFVYLPGSGIKGLARAFATMSGADKATVEAVFGNERPEGGGEQNPEDFFAGKVVFHEAWPAGEQAPRIDVDITTVHHREYYQDGKPPGDWEEPNPVPFLALSPGAGFEFAVSRRTSDCPDALLHRAVQWVNGGLQHLGFGAKTAQGYGRFHRFDTPVKLETPPLPERYVQFEAKLKLVTLGFFAGADQEQGDCDLRPATLRGLLRWWWRTIHAAHLDPKDLLALESALWGDTEQGSAIEVSVRKPGQIKTAPFNRKEFEQPSGDRARREGPVSGLAYLSYGMDEKKTRHFALPNSQWTVSFSARDGIAPNDVAVPRDQVLEQAKAALWLLVTYGAAGSKSRNGYGSMMAEAEGLTDFDLDRCKNSAQSLRRLAGMREQAQTKLMSAALEHSIEMPAIATAWRDPLHAMNEVGAAYQQAIASVQKAERAALGLPRRGAGALANKRLASPMHIHLDQTDDGKHSVRAIAFVMQPPPHLQRGMPSSKPAALERFLKRFEEGVRTSSAKPGPSGATSALQPARVAVSAAHNAGDIVPCRLLEEKTKKGGWKAETIDGSMGGAIINSPDVPADAQPGDELRLKVRQPKGKSDSQFEFLREGDAPHQGGAGPGKKKPEGKGGKNKPRGPRW